MKILMLAPEPFFQPRGTPFSILYRLRALNDLGHSIDLLTYPVGSDLTLEGVTLLRSPRVLGIQSVPIGPSARKLCLDIGLYVAANKLLKERSYDALHTHEEAALFGARLSRRHGVPHVYDMHSQLSKQLAYYRFFRFFVFRRLFESLERKTISSAASLITISPSLQEVALRIDPGSNPVLIENTLDGDDFGVWKDAPEGLGKRVGGRELHRILDEEGEPTLDLRRTYGFPTDSILVVYAGSFEPYQGLEPFLDSFKVVLGKCSRLRLLLVGGKDREIERLKRFAHSVGLGEEVCFAGLVPPPEVAPHLRGADILVSPRREGTNIPSKVYSYLKAGRAIVATNSEAHTQVLDATVALLTDGTSSGMTEALLSLATSPELRGRLGRGAREMARRRCSYENYLEATRRAYDRLNPEKPRHATPSDVGVGG